MKSVRVSNVMWPYVHRVLERDGYSDISFETTKNGIILEVDGMSNRRFTEVVEDAKCEKQRHEQNSGVPVYSYRTLKNKGKHKWLLALNGKRGFHVLKQDIDRCRREKVI